MNTPEKPVSSRISDTVQLALKITFGLLLVGYVLRSRMIDFSALKDVLFSADHLAIGFAFLLFSAVCCSLRWYLLASAQGLSLGLSSTFALNMIGMFFNTFMPGSVGGDLIKAWYVAGREPQNKTKAVFTVLLDRAIGLSVFFFYAAVTLIFYSAWLVDHPQLRWLAYGIWGFTLGSALVGGAFFISLTFKIPGSQWVRRQIARIGIVHKIFEATMLYRNHLRAVLASLALSATSIFGMTLLFKILGDALGIPLALSQYFFVVPIGLTVSAAPLLPGGLGVGQVAFYTLFQWAGLENPEQGATLCTLIQIYTILFNCIGAFFYVRFRRSPSPAAVAT
ncbi:flippase-like domain-containing protein [bacterium]|nr:flippase-like domain-containing protein [bacterium]